MYTGIEFNGKHSYKDFGLYISERNIGNPSKIKRQERVPFSNTVFDFSGIYGGQEYEERLLIYTFEVAYNEKSVAYYLYETQAINWLMSVDKKIKLTDDLIPGYYFLAELVDGPGSDFKWVGGSLTVQFMAYPFKISNLLEGHDIWDEFNFLLDYAQITDFEIKGSKEVTLYNNGASVVKPTIVASAPMQVVKEGITYNIPAGESQSYDFMLSHLENKLTITGNGTISFRFRKELI